jgi:hypothetical protein
LALAKAVAEARAEELKSLSEALAQLDLFGASAVQSAPVPVVTEHRGPGRPPGPRQ